MATITVFTATLREKAQAIRSVLDDHKALHQQLWGQIQSDTNSLPSDVRSANEGANAPWNSNVDTHYDHYYQLARAMEIAADAYESGDHNVQLSFTPTN